MPVVILLDNSLSMFQNVTYGQKTTKKDLACLIAQKIIDQISKNDKQEFISLIAVSSTVQVLCDFTRDFTKLGESLNLLKPGDSFNLESGLTKLNDMVLDTWGCFTNISIILITDEIDNLNQEHSIKNFYLKLKENKAILKSLYDSIGVDYDEENFSKNSILNEDLQSLNINFDFNKKLSNTVIPFSFPNRFDVICLNRIGRLTDMINQESMRFGFDDENFKYKIIKLSDTEKKGKINFLSEILKLNSSVGKVHVIESLDKNFIENEFLPDVLNQLLEPHDFELKCGNLKSLVNLVPSPINKGDLYYGYINKELSGSIEIIGFINIPDFVTPETVSRHIVALNENAESEHKNSFLYLLHTSLKLENMAAIVKLSSDCYGAINCGSDGKVDTKKKSYLTLAIFKPDFYTIEAILSKVPQMEPKVAASPSKTQITQRPQPNKSYAKGCIVWYRAVNLQSDIQKIFRNAKKMHEKMPIFYKELNRVRKAALTFGFYELFQGLSKMFERELINSASSYNADSTAQLTHVIRCLNSPEYKDYRKDIQPWISQAPQSKGHKK